MAPPYPAGPPQQAWGGVSYVGAPPPPRHRPGPGAVVAIAGFLLMLFSLLGLPWISQGGQNVSFPDIRDSVEAANDAQAPGNIGGSGTSGDYTELYTEGFWVVVLLMLVAATVFATLWVPSSHAGRVLIGVVTGGFIGAAIMAVDEDGKVAPRLCGALVTVLAAGAHILLLAQIFDDDIDVSPAYGVWAGVLGLVAVLVGCLMGTRLERREPTPAYGYR